MVTRGKSIQMMEIEDEDVGTQLGVSGLDITMTTNSATMAGSTGKKAKYAVLWQQVGRPKDKTFRPSYINVAAVSKKLALVEKGQKVWWSDSELPRGARPESVEPKYKCPVCPKQFAVEVIDSASGNITPGAMQLDDHIRVKHPGGSYTRWKPMLDKLLATVIADPTMLFANDGDADIKIVRDAEAPETADPSFNV